LVASRGGDRADLLHKAMMPGRDQRLATFASGDQHEVVRDERKLAPAGTDVADRGTRNYPIWVMPFTQEATIVNRDARTTEI